MRSDAIDGAAVVRRRFDRKRGDLRLNSGWRVPIPLSPSHPSYLLTKRQQTVMPIQPKYLWALPAAAALVVTAAWASKEHVVSQKNKAFSVKKLTVKVGESVKFTNDDAFAHNVFSLSAAKSFDTGSFGAGQSKSVTFDKPGKVEVECAVHPDMRMDIEVRP
jgi:plastocyanin